MIIVIPAVFSASEVSKIRSHLDAAEWQDGSTTAGSQAQQVKHNQQLALDNNLLLLECRQKMMFLTSLVQAD